MGFQCTANLLVSWCGDCQERWHSCCSSSGHRQRSWFEFIFRWRWIDPNHFWLTPTADWSWPSPWIELSGSFVDDSAMSTDLEGLTAMALVWRHELDAAMAVAAVEPVSKWRHPLVGLLLAGEWTAWVINPSRWSTTLAGSVWRSESLGLQGHGCVGCIGGAQSPLPSYRIPPQRQRSRVHSSCAQYLLQE